MAAHTPIFILAVLPLAALFILFNFVIHNPTHPETRNNLSLLDVAVAISCVKGFSTKQQQQQQQQEEEHCQLGSSNTESTLAAEVSTQLNQANSHSNDNNLGFQDDIMESWEPSDYLYYPVMADTTVLGGAPENLTTASLNIQSLFGFVVPEFGHG
ncbi:uncharacterized protein BDW43DRAFT_317095 [Aspergillus alliaceus]|uniref:uncharacterized protein n=1 Tax=Petromyces alliaceus TaxID=209559 RepID=UPI0012A73A36|nr:uncharacterized protein BDW43DRAFT_317095 [Aspergillus alliaceus]KAB8227139.1 hypothetical protein BDW43DRAFT_317095 [Aspergillus alliaceus]